MDAPFLASPGTGLRLIEKIIANNPSGCVDWPLGKTGVGRASVLVDGKIWIVARYICERVYGPAPTPRHQAAHRCGRGDKGCYSPACLYWATPKENIADKIRHGTHFRGEQSPTAKLTNEQAVEIYRSTGSHAEIGAAWGISPQLVGRIKRGERYACATGAFA